MGIQGLHNIMNTRFFDGSSPFERSIPPRKVGTDHGYTHRKLGYFSDCSIGTVSSILTCMTLACMIEAVIRR